MTNFLVEAGISDDVINEIKIDNNLLFNLYSNREEVVKICQYLKSINIDDVDEILQYKPSLFLESLDSIQYYFNKFDLNDIVNRINDDYTCIDIFY